MDEAVEAARLGLELLDLLAIADDLRGDATLGPEAVLREPDGREAALAEGRDEDVLAQLGACSQLVGAQAPASSMSCQNGTSSAGAADFSATATGAVVATLACAASGSAFGAESFCV